MQHTHVLHAERISRLDVQVGSILVFLLLVAEETEATAGASERLVCLIDGWSSA